METISIIIVVITGIATYIGLSNPRFFDRYSFYVEGIKNWRQYDRFISSGFLHADWMHFAFNMISFFSFAQVLENMLGKGAFLFLYFGSMLSGNFLSYSLHKSENHYRAVGASGAVMGIIYASIAISPYSTISVFFIPMPSIVVGLLYLVYSLYGMEKRNDNLGHDAHLGGALGGLLIISILEPNVVKENWKAILIMLVPVIIYIIYKNRNKSFKMPSLSKKNYKNIDDKFNEQKIVRQKELNTLLEKVNKYGMDSLSIAEKKRLEELSK